MPEATLPDVFTVPQLAAHWHLGEDKIRGWIQRNELRAANLADRPGQRPRWHIRRQDWEDFLNRRQAKPETKPAKSRKPNKPWREFF